MTTGRHIVVLHRWRDRYAHYEDYVDHSTNNVTYITTSVGQPGVPPSAAEVVVVKATDDLATVGAVVRRLVERHGPPSAIVALKEDDLLVAAEIAAQHGCSTRPLAELVAFRDKLVMARRVAGAGVAVPPFAATGDPAAVDRVVKQHGWPMVVKPRRASSSKGVSVVHDRAALRSAVDTVGSDGLVQAFVDWPIYHLDGVFLGDHLGMWRISKYIGDCLTFRTGTPMGSVEVDDPAIIESAGSATTEIMRSLTSQPTVFHLELFIDAGTTDVGIQFLEVGARVGGGDIPFLWREVHGHDLVADAFRIALGQPPQPPTPGAFTEIAGCVLLPAPAQRPCVVTSSTSMVGRRAGPYAEWLLAPGDVLPDADAFYEHVGARFRFRGSTSAEVAAAVTETMETAQVSGEPLTTAPELNEVATR